MKRKDIDIGAKFGKLTVIMEIGVDKKGFPKYLCKCECGNECVAGKHSLIGNRKKSCGCLVRETARETQKKNFLKHGLSGTRLFEIYRGLKKRCIYKHKDWETYGGRGIKICEEWLGDKGAENFYNWAINNGYKENLTIDRIDNDGNYCPENCRWVNQKQQQRNKRNTLYVNYQNEEITLVELCERLKINYNLVRARIRIGWSLYEAISGKRA